MITPKDKDKVLNAIIIRYEESENHNFILEYDNVFHNREISCDEFQLILEHFKEKRLLSYVSHLTDSDTQIHVSANLFDFFNHGGFVAQEEILLANLQKLGYELEILSKEASPDLLDRIRRIAEIAASVTTALGLFRD